MLNSMAQAALKPIEFWECVSTEGKKSFVKLGWALYINLNLSVFVMACKSERL